MRTNIEKLVKQSVQGGIKHPVFGGYRLDTNGNPYVIPATGGITYNVKVGDPAFGLAGDHVEPGVSIYNSESGASNALNVFSCIGNTAKVITGSAKGALGYVTGTHGGVEHVLIHFDDDILEELTLDDKILVKGYGQGLELLDYPEIKVMSIDPHMFLKMGIEEKDGKLHVPVVKKIPQAFMGSGVGAPFSQKGDYDLITSDRQAIQALGLDTLRFGDVVLLEDSDNTYGLGGMKKGAVSIGVVVHSDCIKAGHGPGITIIMTCKSPLIEGHLDENANIKNYYSF